jgi:hypothetical protein
VGTPAENTQDEIGRIRDDITASVREMQRRFQGGIAGVVTTDVRLLSTEVRTTARERLRQNATLVGFAGTVLVGAVGYGVVSAIGGWRRRQTPLGRAQHAALSLGEDVQERLGESLRGLEQLRRGGVLLKLDPEQGGYVRISDARLLPQPTREIAKEAGSDVVKRVAWAVMLSVFMAAGSVLARRLAGLAWRAAVQEDPPRKS